MTKKSVLPDNKRTWTDGTERYSVSGSSRQPGVNRGLCIGLRWPLRALTESPAPQNLSASVVLKLPRVDERPARTSVATHRRSALPNSLV